MIGLIERYFENGFEVWRLGTTEDEFDNEIEKWELHDHAEGRLRPLGGDRRVVSEKWNVFLDAKFYCPIDTDIKEGDRLKDLEGIFYNVEHVSNPMTMNRFLQVDLTKVVS